MTDKALMDQVMQKANNWLKSKIDNETRAQLEHLINEDQDELIESFYQNLEFGTGGLRGIMGVGTNRVNIYTVGMATQGLSNYLKKQFKGKISQIRVAIAHDSRNNSRLFAEKTADIFSANGFKVYLFDALRPTPELSFAIRYLRCQSGVMVTASHNPKEYNGYKVYWEDGGQIIAPHDKNIIEEVLAIKAIDEINFDKKQENIEILGKVIDEVYTDKVKTLSLSPEVIRRQSDLKIVYTPIHGTGVKLVPMILKKFGFKNIYNVPEQDVVDGNFPTVHSPNPEETAALNLAIEKAKEIDADLVMGTDPDADRVGIVVRNTKHEFEILNGNQTAAILIYYLLRKWKENDKLTGSEYIVKTIVTTELLTELAEHFGVEHYHVLTGFKYIADIIQRFEGEKTFIGGGEESYGYLAGDFVRDKDAVMSCALIAEVAAWAKDQEKTLFDILLDIYTQFSFYKERLISVVRKGKSGAEEIQEMMAEFRKNPPKTLAESRVSFIHDYAASETYDVLNDTKRPIDLPKSNVLQFETQDGTKISIRPSGTEPKIKFYFSVKDKLKNKSKFESVNKQLEDKIDGIIKELNI
ncbi:MAG: phospho-sugar mutase [Bacteroidota bacterium]